MFRTELIELFKVSMSSLKLGITKLASKKSVAFIIATHLTYREILTPSEWLTIALLFMGVEGLLAYKKLIQEVNAPTSNNSGANSEL